MFGPHDFFLLDQWARQLREAFRETPYLVGSTVAGKVDYRDVDVRMLMPKRAKWLAGTSGRLITVNMALSLWGRKTTGLPIDFQLQVQDEWDTYNGNERIPLGGVSKARATEDER